MQVLTLSRRRMDDPAAFTPELVSAETGRIRELYTAGALRQIWKRGDLAGAAILWEAGSVAEVEAMIESLPIRKAGLLEILALVPLEPYPGFGVSR